MYVIMPRTAYPHVTQQAGGKIWGKNQYRPLERMLGAAPQQTLRPSFYRVRDIYMPTGVSQAKIDFGCAPVHPTFFSRETHHTITCIT